MVDVKVTNGVSFGAIHTVTTAEATAEEITFEFKGATKVDYPVAANLVVRTSTSDGGTDQVTEVSTLANTTGSLNDTYFTISSPNDDYYVWFSQAGVAEVSTIETVANTTGSLNGQYFLIDSPTTAYYVWFSTDGTGTDPAIVDRTGINVDLPAGDSTDAEVATALAAALDANADFGAAAALAVVTVTNAAVGVVDDAVDGDTTFTIAVDTQGVDAVSNDPAIVGATGINVDLPAGDSTDAEVATALAAALDAEDDFGAVALAEVVTVTNADPGLVTDAADEDTGFTITTKTAGVNEVVTWVHTALQDAVITYDDGEVTLANGAANFSLVAGQEITIIGSRVKEY